MVDQKTKILTACKNISDLNAEETLQVNWDCFKLLRTISVINFFFLAEKKSFTWSVLFLNGCQLNA